jgi:hypothetical protein
VFRECIIVADRERKVNAGTVEIKIVGAIFCEWIQRQ